MKSGSAREIALRPAQKLTRDTALHCAKRGASVAHRPFAPSGSSRPTHFVLQRRRQWLSGAGRQVGQLAYKVAAVGIMDRAIFDKADERAVSVTAKLPIFDPANEPLLVVEMPIGAHERHPIVPHPVYHRHGEYTTNDVQDDQELWAVGGVDPERDECEQENEHGADDDEGEPMLGSTAAFNQEIAWAPGGRWASHPTGEDEPSLGWSHGRGHPEAVAFGGNDDREDEHVGREPDERALSVELGEGGGLTPTLDQSVQGLNPYDGAERAIAREQRAMAETATRFEAIVQRLRART